MNLPEKLLRLLFTTFILTYCFFSIVTPVRAITDPLSVPNNRIGVHIFDTSEVFQAAKLVNSSGGDWGYVTIPIRSNDRDREKWQAFFANCRQLHLIPIVRLATYVDGDSWVSPNVFDLIDFANFLDAMPWPVKNRYIILFNEPNHSKEWGGYLSPAEYARLMTSAHETFKSRSQDFFLISGGLDMSAPSNRTSLDALSFYKQMTKAHPDWYKSVDGLGFHAYPNPGFSYPLNSRSRYNIVSYRFELNLLKSLGFLTPKPIFITETGYTGQGDFFNQALGTYWTESNIVAITPFVLFAGTGAFTEFSLLDKNAQPTQHYQSIQDMKKITGSPLLNPLLSQTVTLTSGYTSTPAGYFEVDNIFGRFRDIISRPKPQVIFQSVIVDVEVAIDAAAQSKGLSGRSSICEKCGMLFTFDVSGFQTFWMKDMKFPLDFVWMKDSHVTKLDQAVPNPKKFAESPKFISSGGEVDMVLEVNSGFIEKHGIKVGDSVVLNSL